MPFQVDGERRGARRVEVRPSAASELAWLLYAMADPQMLPAMPGLQALRDAAPELGRDLAELWGDERGCLPEATVLAARIDALLGEEADTYLEGLPRAVEADTIGLELRSETAEDREDTLVRLTRLRRDGDALRRYASISTRIWDLARGEWEARGRATVAEACRLWDERLARGTPVRELLPPDHYLNKPGHDAIVELLVRRPAVVVSPIYFAAQGGFVIDLTSFVHVGGPAGTADAEQVHRREAEVVAARLKVLADGTRVALLRRLAEEPSTVMDLARHFRLAQPTVSNHVRMLRDAGLLEAARDGARVVYRAPRQRVARLLSKTQRLLVGTES